MLKMKQNPIEAQLDTEIMTLLDELSAEIDKGSDKYESMIDQLTKLYELRSKSRISKETLANIGANILGIFFVLQHERVHVIATKAFGFVKKIV